MAVTNFTTNLGLALPTTGDLSGTWGDTVNTAITELLDTAVAGTVTLSTDADVTLTTTTGASNQARSAVILWTAANAVTRNITAPAHSKAYVVINAGTGAIVIRGVGPTTGVTIGTGGKALVAWNGSDFVLVTTNLATPGPIGSTTPSTGAFTTLTFSALGTSGQSYIGANSSNTWVNAPTGQLVYQSVGNTAVTTVSSTGLAVTGTLSATGKTTITSTSNDTVSVANASLNLSGSSTVQFFAGTMSGTTGFGYAGYLQSEVGGTKYPIVLNPNGGSVFLGGNTAITGTLSATGAIRESKQALGANDIALNTGNFFSKTISGATTLTVSSVPAAETTASFILDLTNGGSSAITWWSGMKWAGGTAPTLTSAGRDVLGFFTHDGGTTWSGLVLAKDIK